MIAGRQLKFLPVGQIWPIILLFLMIAAADFSGSFRTSSSILAGDSAMIAARALAGIHPEVLRTDFLFSRPQNFEFYNNLSVVFFQLVEMTRLVGPEIFYRLLKGLATFVHLFGWYLLGRRVINSWVAALFFSIACTFTVQTMPGDYWGLYREAQPRVLFAAMLPFLIIMALDCGNSIGRWVILFAAAGVAFWFHPASGPPVALSIMLALLVQKVPKNQIASRLGVAFAGGIVFLLIIAPNFGVYVRDVSRAGEGADRVLAEAAVQIRYSEQYLDVPQGVVSALSSIFAGPRLILAAGAAAATVFLWRFSQGQERRDARFILSFLAVLILVSCVLPAIEHAISTVAGRPPLQLDLIRAVRYVVPFLLLLTIWALARQPAAMFKRFSGPLIAGVWFLAMSFPPTLAKNISPVYGAWCWLHGRLLCADTTSSNTLALINFVAEGTPEDALIFAPTLGSSIRAGARRPLAFNMKDTGWLAYSNHAKLGEYLPFMQRFEEISLLPVNEQAGYWLQMGEDLRADYVVLNIPVEEANVVGHGEIVFQTESGSVIAIGSNAHQ